MPRNISFALTIDQIVSQTKTVTRRKNWWLNRDGRQLLKAGDILKPVDKVMGFKKGEKPELLGSHHIEIVSVRREKLSDITQFECLREGFPEMSPDDFIELYISANGGDADQECTRIEFKYVPIV